MLVSEAIVKILEAEGIKDAFGIPGYSINSLYKFLNSSNIKHYTVRHEEAAVHAAGAYYRATGKIAVALATSGPAATNFVTGLYTANIDSIPVLAITGQAITDQFGKDAFQCVDIAKIVEPVVKASFCITDAAETVEVFRSAFRIMREGKPGAVLIDLPLNIQNSEIGFNPDSYKPIEAAEIEKPAASAAEINQIFEYIDSAENPVIVAGGGVVEAKACAELVKFAETMQIPVISTYMAKGCLPDNHPLNAGHAGIQVGQPIGNAVMLKSDLVIGIGCRFTDRHTGNLKAYMGERKFVHINIEESEINKIIPADLGIVSDAGIALLMLNEAAAKRDKPSVNELVKSLPQLRKSLERRTDFSETPIRPQRVFGELNKAFDEDTIFTTGCGICQIWSGQLQKASKPRRYLASGGAGTLGYDIPAAFGAMIADPGSRAVAVMGDFGFTFHVQELATCSVNEVPVIVVIINNAYLGLIRQNQKYAYGYEYGVQMPENHKHIDYVKVAQGLGCAGERVFKPEDISSALQRAKESKVPYVVDIVVDENADCSMGTAIDAVKEF